MNQLIKSTRALPIVALLMTIGAAGTTIAVSIVRTSVTAVEFATATLASLSPTAARIVAQSVGLTPSALAAAGCGGAEAQALLAAIAARPEDAAAIENLQQESARMLKARREAREAAWRLGGDSSRRLALSTARNGATTEAAALKARRANLRGDMLALLGGLVGVDNAAICRRMIANASRPVPEAWKCLALSSAEWAALERAYAKAASRPIDINGLDADDLARLNLDAQGRAILSAEEQRLLRLARSDATTARVASRLATGLETLEIALTP